MIYSLKKLLFILYQSLMQPLSSGRFSSCLFKAPPPDEPTLFWLVSFLKLWYSQVVGVHYFFSFTGNVNFSNTFVHIQAETWNEIWAWTRGKTLATTFATNALEQMAMLTSASLQGKKRKVQKWIIQSRWSFWLAGLFFFTVNLKFWNFDHM